MKTPVQKLPNYSNILQDGELSYGFYLKQLTLSLFLKTAFERQTTVTDAQSDRWIMQLTTRAEEISHHSPHSRRLPRSRGTAGRDYLWSFTRHWLAAVVLKYRPNF